MTQDEFKIEADKSLKTAIGRANAFLKKLGLTLSVNWDYDQPS